MTSYVVYASDRDSIEIFKDNKPEDFVLQLDKNIVLNDNSTVELLEFRCRLSEKDRDVLYIQSDICENSYLCGKSLPVLRIIPLPGTKNHSVVFDKPIILKSVTGSLNRLRIYISSKHFSEFSVSLLEVQVTLRFNNVSHQ